MARKLIIPTYLPASSDASGRTPKLGQIAALVGAASQVAINSAAFVDSVGVWAELGAGLYSYSCAAAEIPAFGFVALKVKLVGILNGGASECGIQVVTNVTEAKHIGVVQAGTLAAASFTSDLVEPSTAWVDAWCQFKTGTLAGQVKRITAYANSGGLLSFTTGFTNAPLAGDVFELINA